MPPDQGCLIFSNTWFFICCTHHWSSISKSLCLNCIGIGHLCLYVVHTHHYQHTHVYAYAYMLYTSLVLHIQIPMPKLHRYWMPMPICCTYTSLPTYMPMPICCTHHWSSISKYLCLNCIGIGRLCLCLDCLWLNCLSTSFRN